MPYNREDSAYKKVISVINENKDGILSFKELKQKTGASKGSLHRWLKKWKRDRKIGYKIRPKEEGIGPEEVYYKPEIMTFEDMMEKYLLKKRSKIDGMPVAWDMLTRIAFHLGINHTHSDFEKAMKNLAEKVMFRWIPGHEPPWYKDHKSS